MNKSLISVPLGLALIGLAGCGNNGSGTVAPSQDAFVSEVVQFIASTMADEESANVDTIAVSLPEDTDAQDVG